MNKQIRRLLAPVASLKLTVVLFVMAMFLILAGTVAQVNQGIWEVTQLYFRSLFVWIPLNIFVPSRIAQVPGHLPFLGGFAIGGLLLVNLVAAHITRFKRGWKHVGMWSIHAGIILLMLGELGTGLFAYEANMSIDEGHSKNYTENLHAVELAVIDPSDDQVDRVAVVSQAALESAAWREKSIVHEALPFEVRVDRWMRNSQVFPLSAAPQGLAPMATHGLGRGVVARDVPVVSGVEATTINAPSAVVTLRSGGQELGRYFVSLYLDQPQEVTTPDGRVYEIVLRLERRYKPYTIHLLKFTHDKFTGTETPRNFSSLVRLVDPTQNEDRQVLIWMNNPLRYKGETFYQSSYKPDGSGTVLQVVDNPSWLIPYIACTVITLGMTVHFAISLVGFLRRSRR